MPFRERVKRAFRSSSVSDSSSLKKTTSKESAAYAGDMPKPKYRGPVDPKHKEKLEGFSFSSMSFRRTSSQSQYSPFGSRMPSRNNSLTEPRKKFSRGASHVGQVMENSDDSGDVANVGGTRNHSYEGASLVHSSSRLAIDVQDSGNQESLQKPHAHDHAPFTEADVNDALQNLSSKRSAS